MKPFSLSAASIAAVFTSYAFSSTVIGVTAQRENQSPSSSSSCNNSYTKLQYKSTYGMDDGGCYMCTENSRTGTPAEGNPLSESCKQLCESDSSCVAYTVGRAATLPAHEYYSGKQANCCLERRYYPEGAFVDNSAEGTRVGGITNNCHRDTVCWTRYEKNNNDKTTTASIGKKFCPPKRNKAAVEADNFCTKTWDAELLTEAQVQKKMEHIAGGCPYDDSPTYESLLAKAHADCRAEIFVESIDMTIVSHSRATYVHARVDPIGFTMMDGS